VLDRARQGLRIRRLNRGDRRASDAGVRALAEAAARRNERKRIENEPAKSQAAHEVEGRGGLDPTRYGDWEVNGLASDF
jgi:hypothetical protein